MNKAILVTFGLFALVNSLESLISRPVLELESTISVLSESPADSSVLDITAPVVENTSQTGDVEVMLQPEPSIEPQLSNISDTIETEPEQITGLPGQEPSVEAESVVSSPPIAQIVPPPEPSVDVPRPEQSLPEEPVALSPADSLLLLLPELAWPDSQRTRRALTTEIAHEYPNGKFVPRSVINTAWGVGEYLEYSIDYGFYTAGTATMSVLGTEEVNGAPSYHIQTTATSNDFISRFYKVRDQVNSYIDTQGIFSRRIEKILREGDYRSDRFVDFYPDRQIAVSTVDKHAVTEIPLYVQDVLSSLYLIRTYPLEVGKDFSITTFADGKVYPLKVTVHKMETISVPAGKFRCYVVEPFLQSDGIFRQKGKLTVWLTADEHRIPVKMTSKIVIGNIGTNLTSYRLGVTE